MKAIDYSGLRLNRLKEPQYRHIFYLLFWPAFGLAFLLLERFLPFTYHTVECRLDSYIPFCEFFVIPYFFWFVFMFWIMVYGFFFDIDAFKKFSRFIIITYTVTAIIYFVYPTMQQLRPDEFARDNIFTDIVKLLYGFDTNTNVCPSIHILGAMASFFTAWHSKRYCTAGWRILFLIITVLVCLSTVFLKQHSIIDIVSALILCAAAYPFVYLRKSKPNTKVKEYATKI